MQRRNHIPPPLKTFAHCIGYVNIAGIGGKINGEIAEKGKSPAHKILHLIGVKREDSSSLLWFSFEKGRSR